MTEPPASSIRFGKKGPSLLFRSQFLLVGELVVHASNPSYRQSQRYNPRVAVGWVRFCIRLYFFS